MDLSGRAVEGQVRGRGVEAGRRWLFGQARRPTHAGEARALEPLTELGEVPSADGVGVTKEIHDTNLGVWSGKLVGVTTFGLGTGTSVLEQDETRTLKAWKVLVWNDPVTPMVVVTAVFKKIFGYPEEKATALMLTVHHEGKAIVWSGAKNRAEQYCVALQTHGLLSTIEQDD